MTIEFPDPDMFGADIAHWQRFLKSRGLYSGDISGNFDYATQQASIEFQRKQNLHENTATDDAVFEAARSLGYEIPQRNPRAGEYFNRGGGVEVSLSDAGTLHRFAYYYY